MGKLLGPARAAWMQRCAYVVLILAVLGTVAGAAVAAPSSKFYGTDLFGYAIRGEVAPVTLRVINRPASTQTLGSVNFEIPTAQGIGVTVPALNQTVSLLTSDPAKSWTVTQVLASGKYILQFRANASKNALDPGQLLDAPISVSASCTAVAGSFTSSARQSNDFSGARNEFTASGLNVSVAVKRLARKIAFTAQPTSTTVNTVIAPAMKVTAFTVCPSDVAIDASGSVALDLSNDSAEGEGLLQGTATKSISAASATPGVATFDDLSVSLSGATYSLGAKFDDDLTLTGPDLTALQRGRDLDIYDSVCTNNGQPTCSIEGLDDRRGTGASDGRLPRSGAQRRVTPIQLRGRVQLHRPAGDSRSCRVHGHDQRDADLREGRALGRAVADDDLLEQGRRRHV